MPYPWILIQIAICLPSCTFGKVEGCGSPMGAPQKLPTTPPPLTPPYKSGESTIFGKITCFWRKTLVPTINYVIFVSYGVSYSVSYGP